MTNLSGINLNNGSAAGAKREGMENPSHSLASMPQYEDYVDSGVEWLGRVPSHWQITRLKNTINGCVNGLWGADPNGKDELVVVRVADFDEQKLNVSDEKLTYRSIPENERKSRLLKFGDLLIEKSGGGDKTLVGRVVLFDKSYTAVTSNFVAKMTPKNWVNHSFLKYVFFSLYSRGVNYVSIKQTTGIQNLDANSYLNEVFCFPDEFVQAEVANFLDKKTAQIDEAIAIKEQQISLLKERKQIIIQQAVTQGLDPNVPMKDSGVDWIGKIPEHWEVRRAKYIFKKENRPVRLEDEVVTCFRDGQVTLRTNRRTEGFTFATKEHGYQGIRKGDLVIHAMDAFAGAIGVSDSDGKSSPVYSACTPVTGVKVNPKYYALYLRNLALGGFIESLAKGIRERSTDFRYKDFSELFFPLPDIETQNKVVLEIEKSHQEIDGGISVLTKQIEKIKEYKTSLINSAVTGKIKITPEMIEQ